MSAGYAWGPNRKTFKEAARPNYACFNSVVDNPGVGDERNFVRVREVGSTAPRTDMVRVVEGGVYEIYIYFRNDAYATMATGVRLQTSYGQLINRTHDSEVMAAISSPNATPAKVWDRATLWTDSEDTLVLSYVNNSAKIHNSSVMNGSLLEMGIFSAGGGLIGYDEMNGNLAAGAQYAGYVTYEVKAEKAMGGVDYSSRFGAEITEEITSGGETGLGGGSGSTPSVAGSGSTTNMPVTGGDGVALALVMGALVVFGWSVLRKIVKRDKIRKV